MSTEDTQVDALRAELQATRAAFDRTVAAEREAAARVYTAASGLLLFIPEGAGKIAAEARLAGAFGAMFSVSDREVALARAERERDEARVQLAIVLAASPADADDSASGD